MEAGDVLVLEATTDFVEQFSQSNHFALVSGWLLLLLLLLLLLWAVELTK